MEMSLHRREYMTPNRGAEDDDAHASESVELIIESCHSVYRCRSVGPVDISVMHCKYNLAMLCRNKRVLDLCVATTGGSP
jgi:hypothetical protein